MLKKTDQRTRLTQYLIRKSLTELLREKPIQSISIKELCEVAGINRGTFYSHYEDIYQLLRKIEEEMLTDFQKALQPLLKCSEEDFSAIKITAGIFNCIKDNADLCIVTLGPYGDKEFASRLLAVGRERCLESYRKYFEKATPAKPLSPAL